MTIDLLGNEIRIGDKVAYGSRDGNRGVISVGEVVSIKDGILKVKVGHSTKYGFGKYGVGSRLSQWLACASVKL